MKGQYYRLFLSTAANPDKVIAAAKTMSLHGSLQTQESSTKDTTGDALEYEAVGQSYDISGSALMVHTDDTESTVEGMLLEDFIDWVKNQSLYWRICLCNSVNNRTITREIAYGTCKCTQLQMQGQNRQNAQFSYTLQGVGKPTICPPGDYCTLFVTKHVPFSSSIDVGKLVVNQFLRDIEIVGISINDTVQTCNDVAIAISNGNYYLIGTNTEHGITSPKGVVNGFVTYPDEQPLNATVYVLFDGTYYTIDATTGELEPYSF